MNEVTCHYVYLPSENANASVCASPVMEESILFEDHSGSILLNRAKTSLEGQCGGQPE